MEIFRHPQPVSDLSVRGTRPHGDRLNFDPRNLAREINRFRDLDSLTLVSLDSQQMELLERSRPFCAREASFDKSIVSYWPVSSRLRGSEL